jgi:hypothetical protein
VHRARKRESIATDTVQHFRPSFATLAEVTSSSYLPNKLTTLFFLKKRASHPLRRFAR